MRRRLLVVVVLAGTAVALWGLFPSSGRLTAQSTGEPLLIVYSEVGFQGQWLEVRDSVLDLPEVKMADGSTFDWNDAVRSVRVVSGTWRLYQHGRLNTELDETPVELLDMSSRQLAKGWSVLLSGTSRGSLELLNPEMGGFGEDVSSIELVSSSNLPDWAAP